MGLFGLFGNKTDINEAVAGLNDNPQAVLLDVREPSEYASGHIPGSRNYPVGSIAKSCSDFPDKDAPIYVYCQSGVRSSAAAKTLRNAGFTNVTDLGGIMRYKSALER